MPGEDKKFLQELLGQELVRTEMWQAPLILELTFSTDRILS